MQSLIKKSILIKDFKEQVKNKRIDEILKLDKSFFRIVNRVYKSKPTDLKFHITKHNTIAFNIEFPDGINVYLEYFIDRNPNTLMSVNMVGDDFNTEDDLFHGNLDIALNKIDLVSQKRNVTN